MENIELEKFDANPDGKKIVILAKHEFEYRENFKWRFFTEFPD